jgi:hypothetical protein
MRAVSTHHVLENLFQLCGIGARLKTCTIARLALSIASSHPPAPSFLTHRPSQTQSAQQEAFIFDIPVTVQWNSLDSGLLQKLWALSPEHQKLKEKFAPEVADRLLVFHRGVGVAKAKGLYFWEKVRRVAGLVAWVPSSCGGMASTDRRQADVSVHQRAAQGLIRACAGAACG